MYVVAADVKEFAGIAGDDVDPNIDTVIGDVIGYAEEWINAATGTVWVATAATKLFDYYSGDVVLLDSDLYSLTSITNGDGTAVATSDVFLYPRKGPPYRRIERKLTSSFSFNYPTAEKRQAITVVGRWGRTATPPKEVQTVTCILAAQVLNEARQAGVTNVSADFANTTFDRKTHPMVEGFVKRYRRPRAA